MLTEKDYCDRDTAIALQKLGYNNKYCRDDGTPVITLYEAQKWLREEKLLHIVIDKLLYGAYEFSVVDILNYSKEKTVQLILTKTPF